MGKTQTILDNFDNPLAEEVASSSPEDQVTPLAHPLIDLFMSNIEKSKETMAEIEDNLYKINSKIA
jgi:hypothetical protein